MAKITNIDLESGFDKDYLIYTNNLNNAMWITPSAKLADGHFDNGLRGADHRDVLLTDGWDGIERVSKNGAVRISPETKTIQTFDGTLSKLNSKVRELAVKFISLFNYELEALN